MHVLFGESGVLGDVNPGKEETSVSPEGIVEFGEDLVPSDFAQFGQDVVNGSLPDDDPANLEVQISDSYHGSSEMTVQ